MVTRARWSSTYCTASSPNRVIPTSTIARQQSTMTDEQVGLAFTVVIGGVDTPIAVITNGLASLLHHRDQYERPSS